MKTLLTTMLTASLALTCSSLGNAKGPGGGSFGGNSGGNGGSRGSVGGSHGGSGNTGIIRSSSIGGNSGSTRIQNSNPTTSVGTRIINQNSNSTTSVGTRIINQSQGSKVLQTKGIETKINDLGLNNRRIDTKVVDKIQNKIGNVSPAVINKNVNVQVNKTTNPQVNKNFHPQINKNTGIAGNFHGKGFPKVEPAKFKTAPHVVAKNYHLTAGKSFSHGYCYPGHHHHHWSHYCWWPRFGCYTYWDPCTCGYYYWSPVHTCYYPVSYATVVAPVASTNVIDVAASPAPVISPAPEMIQEPVEQTESEVVVANNTVPAPTQPGTQPAPVTNPTPEPTTPTVPAPTAPMQTVPMQTAPAQTAETNTTTGTTPPVINFNDELPPPRGDL